MKSSDLPNFQPKPLKQPLTAYHIAPRDRRASILSNGLETHHPRSGIRLRQYSREKLSKVIYLYKTLDVINWLSLLQDVGLQWDVYQVTIRSTEYLVKQEGRIARNWESSMVTAKAFGSLLDIPKEDVVHLFTVDGTNEAMRK